MSTVEQTANDGQRAGTGRAVSAHADEHLAAIDELIVALQTTTSSYHGRLLDWGDVASLRQVRDHLHGAVEGFNAAAAAAELSRASREVAMQLRQLLAT